MDQQDLNYGVRLANKDPKEATRLEELPPDSNREFRHKDQPREQMKPNGEPNGEPNGGPNGEEYNLSQAAHPFACIFTFIFKVLAFLTYFVIGNFLSEVTTFITVVILSALDFWTVKNVTGRLLVGLRWWSDFDESGKEVWKFQSYDREFKSNRVDTTFFWTSQYAATGTWCVFLVMKVLSFSVFWSLLVLINLSLTGTNLYGYFKCQRDHGQKISKLKSNILGGMVGKLMK